jgi:hypothetical protein
MSAKNYQGKPIKKALAYSELTDKVYWIDGNGNQIDITQNFLQIVGTWACKGSLDAVPTQRVLTSAKHKFTISVSKRAES